MANNKQIKITLDLDAQISSLEKKVSQAKATMQKAFGAGTTPELENAFKSIIKVLDTIKEKTKTPIVSQAGFNAVAAQIGKADVALEKLYDAFENLANLSEDRKIDLLPDDVRKNVRDTIQVFGEFEDVLKNAEVKTKDLIKAENELAKSKDKLETLAAKREGIKKLQDQAQAEEVSLKASLDKIKALEEEQEELEKLNKLYEKQGVNKTKRLTDKKGNVVASLPAQRQRVNRAKLAVDTDPVAAANAGKSASELSAMLREASSKVTPYSSEIRKLDSDINILGVTIEGLEAKLKELNSAFESKKTEDVNSAFLDLRAAANKAGIAIDDIPVEYTEDGFKELQSRLAAFKTQAVDPLNKSIKSMGETMEEGAGSVREMGEEIEVQTESFNQQNEALSNQKALEDRIKNFIGWAGASELLRRSLNNAFSAVKELDAVMTEMAVVTDLSVGDYWDQLPEYTERANDLGVSIRSAYESATLYYQQGLKTNEVTAVSAETLKLMKIAGISAEDATNKMTAALRGFNMEINEMNAQKVSDVYAELAAITAADVDEISNAMTKTASIASSANMEFETTAAFLSQIIETTRESSETAGTAMKTIIARFQELKKAPEEIGEVDGEIVDANAIETALRTVGVALRDANGQFRDLDDVFLELSSKWSGLDTNTQRYIATIAAGSRQQSRFIAMMSDYGRTQELVSAANNSAGASQKQYEKTLESLESKLAKLENAWTTFSTSIMNSDLIKTGVDILTALITALDKVSQGFGGMTGSLAKIGMVITLFNTAKALFIKLSGELNEWFTQAGRSAGAGFAQGVRESGGMLPPGANISPQQAQQVTQRDKGSIKNNLFGFKNSGDATQERSKVGVAGFVAGFRSVKNANSDNTKEKIKQLQEEKKATQEIIKTKKEELQREKERNGETERYLQIAGELEEQENRLIDQDKQLIDTQSMANQGLQQMTETLTQIGSALTIAGVGFGMLSETMENAGNSEAADTFAKMGNVLTTLGTVLGALGAAFKIFSFTIQGESEKLVIAGIQTQLAWWWIFVIIAAVAVLIGLIVLLIAALNEPTAAEKNLKKAQEASEAAGEAASKAAEQYNTLVEALEKLEDKYKALEDLTKGTKEWNEAVQDINNSVLDLIEQYPELAKFVENRGGILTIDQNREGVQEVVSNAQKGKNAAARTEIGSNIRVAEAELDVAREQFVRGEISESEFRSAQQKAQSAVEANETARTLVMSQSMDLSDLSTEQQDVARNLYSAEANGTLVTGHIANVGDSVKNAGNKNAEEQTNQLNSYRNEWAQDIYGSGARVDKNGKIFDAKGKEIGEVNDDVVKTHIAEKRAEEDAKDYMRVLSKNVMNTAEEGSSIANLITSSDSQRNITYKDIKGELSDITDNELKELYSQITAEMSDEQKKMFGTEEEFIQKQRIYITEAQKTYADFDEAIGKLENVDATNFGNINEAVAQSIATKIRQSEALGYDTAEIMNRFNSEMDNMTEEQRQAFELGISNMQWNEASLAKLSGDAEEFALEVWKQIYAKNEVAALKAINTLGGYEDLAVAEYNLEEALRIRTEAEEKYNEVLEETGVSVSEITQAYDKYIEALEAQNAELDNSSVQATHLNLNAFDQLAGMSYGGLVTRNNDGTLEIKDDFIRLLNDPSLNEDTKNELEKYFNQIEENNETIRENEKQKKANLKTEKEVLEKQKEQFLDMEQRIADALVQERQDVIDQMSLIATSIMSAQDELVSTIESRLSETRQDESIQQQTQDLQDKEAQLAYLMTDTSANPLTIAQLQEEIQQNKETLSDTIEDATLEELRTGNEIAQMQREEQIKLAQSQLDWYAENTVWQKVADYIQNTYDQLATKTSSVQDTELYKLLVAIEGEGLSPTALSEFEKTLGSELTTFLAAAKGYEYNEETGWQLKDETKPEETEETPTTYQQGITNTLLTDTMHSAYTGNYANIDEARKNDDFMSLFNELSDSQKQNIIDKGKWSGTTQEEHKQNVLSEASKYRTHQEAYGDGTTVYAEHYNAIWKKDQAALDNELKDKYRQDYSDVTAEQILKDYGSSVDFSKTSISDWLNITDSPQYYWAKDIGEKNINPEETIAAAKAQEILDGQTYYYLGDLGSYTGPSWSFDSMGFPIGHDSSKTFRLKLGEKSFTFDVSKEGNDKSTSAMRDQLNQEYSNPGSVVWANGHTYVRDSEGNWYSFKHSKFNEFNMKAKEAALAQIKKSKGFKTGGLADFTGPAWLDGTPTKPELVLNQRDTQNFIALKDVLAEAMSNSKLGGNSGEQTGDAYIDVDINVDKIDNDYDVEQLARKVREMITNDAMYRNVVVASNFKF